LPITLEASMLTCPGCSSDRVVKNGKIHNGKQSHKCRACGRQFVKDPQPRRISEATKHLVDAMLLENIPLAGIARVTQASSRWLQYYGNEKYAQVERRADPAMR
jgi:transposase-like protein